MTNEWEPVVLKVFKTMDEDDGMWNFGEDENRVRTDFCFGNITLRDDGKVYCDGDLKGKIFKISSNPHPALRNYANKYVGFAPETGEIKIVPIEKLRKI